MADKDLISLYLKDIKKHKLLSKEEEFSLLVKAKNGDIEAKNELITSNLKLVVNIAKGYVNKGMSFIDLISEGNMGLIYAIDKFDICYVLVDVRSYDKVSGKDAANAINLKLRLFFNQLGLKKCILNTDTDRPFFSQRFSQENTKHTFPVPVITERRDINTRRK